MSVERKKLLGHRTSRQPVLVAAKLGVRLITEHDHEDVPANVGAVNHVQPKKPKTLLQARFANG